MTVPVHEGPAADTSPEPTPPAPSGSKAGRNLPAAIGVGVGLGLLVIGVLVYAPSLWTALVAAAMAIATWEIMKRLGEAGIEVPRIPLLLGGQAIIWLGWPYGTTGVLGAFAATVLVTMVWRLFSHGASATPQNYLRDTGISLFVISWVPLLAAFAALMVHQEDGAGRIFVFMIGVVCSDVGGYVAGVLFGKHPMVPRISPKKSWEGLAGSLVFAIIGSVLTVTLILDGNPWVGVLVGITLVLTGTIGDLIESQVKRDLKIKDMGTLLPGHGGIMDRLDSMLPSAFVTWLVLTSML
ncbi:MAG: phosphatidate cytidylyltransferase [Rhodococcus sp.]|nr:phosphatidate cytidylyltransferase [Rhodococcus sp. (in: high G+C Gram-positive bacteria)]